MQTKVYHKNITKQRTYNLREEEATLDLHNLTVKE